MDKAKVLELKEKYNLKEPYSTGTDSLTEPFDPDLFFTDRATHWITVALNYYFDHNQLTDRYYDTPGQYAPNIYKRLEYEEGNVELCRKALLEYIEKERRDVASEDYVYRAQNYDFEYQKFAETATESQMREWRDKLDREAISGLWEKQLGVAVALKWLDARGWEREIARQELRSELFAGAD